MRPFLTVVAAVCAIACLSAPLAEAQSPSGARLRVQLHWLHQAQFAGLYVAETLGFYDRESIDVEVVPGGPGIEPLAALDRKDVDVALGWFSGAMDARRKGADVVNIAQMFQRPAVMLVCRRAAGVRRPADVKGRRVGVWNLGEQYDVTAWLAEHGLTSADVTLVPQRADARDLIEGGADCVTAMSYNEYGSILASGLTPADLFVVRFSDVRHAFLEDGFYARGADLANPAAVDRLGRFLRATAAGWRYAEQNRDEAVSIVQTFAPGADGANQRRMLDGVLELGDPHDRFGLLDLGDFRRSVEIVGRGMNDAADVAAAARGAWTHRVWYAAGLEGDSTTPLSEAVRYYLAQVVALRWFHFLDLAGTAAFAVAGFMHARRRRYDIGGAFFLTLLPAVGGGTLRDLLVGGDRLPLFIFRDPTYLYVVFAVVVIGTMISLVLPNERWDSGASTRGLALLDTLGLAAFTVIGAAVALTAGLAWFWVPVCSALTCAGGGTLLDIATGREPRTFKGEPYEEVSAAGGLFLVAGLVVANRFEHAEWLVAATILVALAGTAALRLAVVRYGVRSPVPVLPSATSL